MRADAPELAHGQLPAPARRWPAPGGQDFAHLAELLGEPLQCIARVARAVCFCELSLKGPWAMNPGPCTHVGSMQARNATQGGSLRGAIPSARFCAGSKAWAEWSPEERVSLAVQLEGISLESAALRYSLTDADQKRSDLRKRRHQLQTKLRKCAQPQALSIRKPKPPTLNIKYRILLYVAPGQIPSE